MLSQVWDSYVLVPVVESGASSPSSQGGPGGAQGGAAAPAPPSPPPAAGLNGRGTCPSPQECADHLGSAGPPPSKVAWLGTVTGVKAAAELPPSPVPDQGWEPELEPAGAMSAGAGSRSEATSSAGSGTANGAWDARQPHVPLGDGFHRQLSGTERAFAGPEASTMVPQPEPTVEPEADLTTANVKTEAESELAGDPGAASPTLAAGGMSSKEFLPGESEEAGPRMLECSSTLRHHDTSRMMVGGNNSN